MLSKATRILATALDLSDLTKGVHVAERMAATQTDRVNLQRLVAGPIATAIP